MTSDIFQCAGLADSCSTATNIAEHPLMLSVIIPCYNEQATIRSVTETVLQADSSGMRKEIVVVDDCSTDGTRELLQQVSDDYRSDKRGTIRILCHSRNQGKGAAVRTGWQKAGGDVVLVQDADLEYDPIDYPALLAPILSGHADVVVATAFMAVFTESCISGITKPTGSRPCCAMP